jgi:hypothetical protein
MSDVMEPYPARGGDSGVAAFEIRPEAIVLRFKDGGVYLYDRRKPGRHHVEQMKQLARAGRGLATYMNRNVRENYAARLE